MHAAVWFVRGHVQMHPRMQRKDYNSDCSVGGWRRHRALMSANVRVVLARPARPVGFGDAPWRYEIAAGPLTRPRQVGDTLSRRERAGVNGVAI